MNDATAGAAYATDVFAGISGVADGTPRVEGAIDDPRVQAVLAYQAAMARGDRDFAKTVFSSDVVYVVSGRGAFAGIYRGPEAVMDYLGMLMERTAGSFSISQMRWFTTEEHVTLITRNHARLGERALSWDEVIVFRFVAGKKKRIDLFSGAPDAVAAFFAR